MTKNLLLTLALIILVALSFSVVFAEPIPTLTLTVEKSPLDVWPPMMIYTAKLSCPPPSTELKCNFLNSPDLLPAWIPIGSDLFDNNGVAQISVQMNPGGYQAMAETTINGTLIRSNIVRYKVP